MSESEPGVRWPALAAAYFPLFLVLSMKPGYKKKAVTSKKKLANQQRKEAKHAESLSEKADVELDVAGATAAMGALCHLL